MQVFTALDGSVLSTALCQRHPRPFPQQNSPGHSWRGGSGSPAVLHSWRGGSGSPAVLHGSECGLCAAVDLQVHPRLRGLSEDHRRWKCSSYGPPPLPWAFSSAQGVECYFWQKGKKTSAVLSYIFCCILPICKEQAKPLLLNTAGWSLSTHSSTLLPSRPVHRWSCLFGYSPGHDPKLRY